MVFTWEFLPYMGGGVLKEKHVMLIFCWKSFVFLKLMIDAVVDSSEPKSMQWTQVPMNSSLDIGFGTDSLQWERKTIEKRSSSVCLALIVYGICFEDMGSDTIKAALFPYFCLHTIETYVVILIMMSDCFDICSILTTISIIMMFMDILRVSPRKLANVVLSTLM